VASTSSVTIAAAAGQVDVVRVHDVAQTRDALAVADAVARAGGGGRRFV
jgi:dihydropteroate synthase